jgi:hypothetical protein
VFLQINGSEEAGDPTEREFWSRFQGEPRVPGGDVFHEPARYSDETMPKWPGFVDIIGLDMAYSTTKLADFAAVVAIRAFRNVDGKSKGFIRYAERFKLDLTWVLLREAEAQKTYGGLYRTSAARRLASSGTCRATGSASKACQPDTTNSYAPNARARPGTAAIFSCPNMRRGRRG